MLNFIRGKALGVVSIASAIAIAVLFAWGWNEHRLHKYWRKITLEITAQTAFSTRQDKMEVKDVRLAIRRLGIERDAEMAMRQAQTRQIRAWEAETARLQKLAVEERNKARAAIAARDEAIARLAREMVTPGERAECSKIIRESEEILLYLYREGL